MTDVYHALIIFVLIQRIAELGYSRFNQRRLREHGYQNLERPGEFNWMVWVHALWIIGLIVEPILSPGREISNGLAFLGLSVFVMAQLLRFWTLSTLGIHWNVNIMRPGQNAATDMAPFISSGPYRWIRHPNYLVVILELMALPLCGGAYLTGIFCSILNGVVLARRIDAEESLLRASPGYEATMMKKGGLLPRF